MTEQKMKQVVYYYDEEVGNFCYGGGNPMRPHRARMVFSLLKHYGLLKHVSLHRPIPRTFDELTAFHADGKGWAVWSSTRTVAGLTGAHAKHLLGPWQTPRGWLCDLTFCCNMHTDYIEFLRTVTPNNAEEYQNQLRRFNMGMIGDVDCPVFDGCYDFCAVSVWLCHLLAHARLPEM